MFRSWKLAVAIALAAGAGSAVTIQSARADTFPPPGYVEFIPICYHSTNGNARFVKPWGVAGASIPNCTPPAPWNFNPPYSPMACTSGGLFDCTNREFYTEIGFSGSNGAAGQQCPANKFVTGFNGDGSIICGP
jgi:hypothetical protein